LTVVGAAVAATVPPPVGALTGLLRATAGDDEAVEGDEVAGDELVDAKLAEGELADVPPPNLVDPLWTVMLIAAVPIRPLPRSVYERTTVALPTVAGVNVRPLRAALRLASVPSIVIDVELLAPLANVIPFVLPKVSVPDVADSVSGSTVLPALMSAMLTAFLLALEKTNDAETTTAAVGGAVIAGALAATVSPTLEEAERPSALAVSRSEMARESKPV
jgi:hypothetical protein